MIELAEHYDPDIPALENEAYMAKAREMVASWEGELQDEMKAILHEIEAAKTPIEQKQ